MATLTATLKNTDDADARVRLQAALSLGEVRHSTVSTALGKLAGRDGADAWFRAAILSSVPDTAIDLLTAIVQSSVTEPSRFETSQQLLQPLSAITGARHNDEETGTLLQTIAVALQGRSVQQADCLTGLLEGLQRGEPQRLTAKSGQDALRKLLFAESGRVRSCLLYTSPSPRD